MLFEKENNIFCYVYSSKELEIKLDYSLISFERTLLLYEYFEKDISGTPETYRHTKREKLLSFLVNEIVGRIFEKEEVSMMDLISNSVSRMLIK